MEAKLTIWNSHFLQFSKMLDSCNAGKFLERVGFYRNIGEYEIKNFNCISRRTYDECQMLLNEISWFGLDSIESNNAESYKAYLLVSYFSEFLDNFHNGN